MRFHSISVSCNTIYGGNLDTDVCVAVASLALFNRTVFHFDVATGEEMVTGTYETQGQANATHTEPYVALPTSTATSSASAEPIVHPWRRN